MCGHDGHAASLLGCAYAFARQRPARGRVVLMFQPAEEDGSGAAAVIADPRFAEMVLVRNSRLSVQPVTQAEWDDVMALAGAGNRGE